MIGSPIPVGPYPFGLAITPDDSKVYVANTTAGNPGDVGTVSVISTATDKVIGEPITVGSRPVGVAITPDGSKVYVTHVGDNTVRVISTATNTVIGSPITVGSYPIGVAVTPDGSKVYVANHYANTVSVISTATDKVIGSPIPVGTLPTAFGLFIQPAKKFAGTPGRPNCHGKSVSALAVKYDDGIKGAAESLGYPSVAALQDAITTFCGG